MGIEPRVFSDYRSAFAEFAQKVEREFAGRTIPDGEPFIGTSNYLRITDTTQNWVAGYTGSTCGISLSSWVDVQIQLVANLGQSGTCVLAAGDNLLLEVWNPQTMVKAESNVTVAAAQ